MSPVRLDSRQPRSQSSSAKIDVTSPVKFDRELRLERLAKNRKFKMADDYEKNLRDLQAASQSAWDPFP